VNATDPTGSMGPLNGPSPSPLFSGLMTSTAGIGCPRRSCVSLYRPPPVREPSQALHDVPCEEDHAFVCLVQHALLVEPLEYPDVRWVKNRRVRVPEDGDEFVCVDLGFDCAKGGVAALVCE
jgi:hypothetical protein